MTQHLSADEVREHTLAQANAYLAHLRSGDWDAYADLWAEDATFVLPFAPDGQPQALHGKDAILAHMTQIMGVLVVDDVPALDIIPGADGETVVAEILMHMRLEPDGIEYHQRYVSVFRFEDGLLKTYHEYSNPLIFLEAFGALTA